LEPGELDQLCIGRLPPLLQELQDIKSVHKRAAAIIAKEGAQVNKADYD